MNILVLNCGSSSLKFQVIETSHTQIDRGADRLLAKGVVERIGGQALLRLAADQGPSVNLAQPIRDHAAAIHVILEWLVKQNNGHGLNSLTDIHAVGHRVVHGGEHFKASVRITPEVVKGIEDCIELAPLHNPANLSGIRAVTAMFGTSFPQVAVFDTSFHTSMPETSYLYAIPYQLYRRHKIRRYGFHGTSHRYVSYRYRQMLKKAKSEVNIITLHLGNGCSACAIKGGVSVDTSMGLTPMEGLVMGTRSGDVDPAILEFIAIKEGLQLSEVITILNKQSGLLGLSGLTNDMRELLDEEKENKDRRATLAIDIFARRVRHYIGAYLAELPQTEALIFTGGIGENAATVRARIAADLGHLGFDLDAKANANLAAGHGGLISRPNSARAIYVIPTNEELLIARDTLRQIQPEP